MDPAAAARFAGLALKCLHQEYPNHLSTTLDTDADALQPRKGAGRAPRPCTDINRGKHARRNGLY